MDQVTRRKTKRTKKTETSCAQDAKRELAQLSRLDELDITLLHANQALILETARLATDGFREAAKRYRHFFCR